ELGGEEGTRLRLVETATAKVRWSHPVKVDGPGAFTPDGGRVIVLSGNRPLTWDVPTGRLLRGTPAEETRWVYPGPPCLSPDGRTAVVGSQGTRRFVRPGVESLFPIPGTQLRLVETATGQVRRDLPLVPPVWSAAFTRDGRHLLTGGEDGAPLVWAPAEHAARPLTADAWADLAATGPTAYTAVCSLAAHSGEAVRLLGERLRPVAVDAKRVRAWVADLDAEAFDQRQEAEKQLAALQEHVEGDLRESLAGASPEARSRLVRLLQRIEDGPERWRRSRSLE